MACRQKRISRFTISKSLDILLVLGFHVDATPDLGKLCSWQIRSSALGKSNLNSAAVSSFFASNTLRSTAVTHNSETKRRCSFSAHCTLYIAHNSGTKRHWGVAWLLISVVQLPQIVPSLSSGLPQFGHHFNMKMMNKMMTIYILGLPQYGHLFNMMMMALVMMILKWWWWLGIITTLWWWWWWWLCDCGDHHVMQSSVTKLTSGHFTDQVNTWHLTHSQLFVHIWVCAVSVTPFTATW